MKRFVFSAVISTAVLPLACANSQDRPFTVEDDIAMVRFSDPLPEHSLPGSEIAKPSPNGKYVAVVTTKGLLASNQIESEISVFNLTEMSAFLETAAAKPPKPRVIATIVSFPHREEPNAYAPVIKDLRWCSDMTHIYFKGENRDGAYQLYRANLDGSGFHALTPADSSVGRFDVAKDLIVYTASRLLKDPAVPIDSINSDAEVMTGKSLEQVLFSGQLNSLAPETFTMSTLHATKGGWSASRVSQYSVREIPYLSFLSPFVLSPKRDKLIVTTPITTVPEVWKQYDPAAGFDRLRLHGDDPRTTNVEDLMRPQQYSLVDLKTGRVVPLIDAPGARSLAYYLDENRAVWTPDEQRVLVTNTFLRIDKEVGSDSSQSNRPCAVASVDLSSLRTRCLFLEERELQPEAPHVQEVSFGANNDEALVLLKHGAKEQTVQRYQLQNGRWILISSAPISTAIDSFDNQQNMHGARLTVFIKQSLNDPPTLWVSDSKTRKARQLWNPNPQFGRIRFGQASIYHWKDKTGYEWTGGLIKPVDYVSGRTYPLVIQMYSFTEDQFLTDGTYPTAFAARELAGAGFVVLQIRKKPSTQSEADPRDHLDAYRSAIENLSQTGLIDPTKVGVVGFSWTCWYAVNALIEEPKLFAAATIADGLDNSYMQYLLFAVEAQDIQSQMEQIRGTNPFGNGLKRWVEQAPGFHLDKVQAPLRIEAINPLSVLQEWELYSALRLQNKVVDLIYFPRGTHIHQKPLERLESQQGDVDWFRFWLQNYEDPNPSKSAQYERWGKLKALNVTAAGH